MEESAAVSVRSLLTGPAVTLHYRSSSAVTVTRWYTAVYTWYTTVYTKSAYVHAISSPEIIYEQFILIRTNVLLLSQTTILKCSSWIGWVLSYLTFQI